MTLTPSALSSAMTSSSRSVSASGQARGRLVDDDQARIERQRLGDLDQLLLGERQLGDRRVGRESRRRGGRAAAAPRRAACVRSISCSEPPCSGSRPMKTLAATSRLSNRLSSWWTKAMPAADRLADGERASRSTPSISMRAARRRDHAAEDLHQRRLAGAVLADQADHLARRDRQRDIRRAPRRRDRSCVIPTSSRKGSVEADDARQHRAAASRRATDGPACEDRPRSSARLAARVFEPTCRSIAFSSASNCVDVVLVDDLGRDDDQPVGRDARLVALEILRPSASCPDSPTRRAAARRCRRSCLP